MKKAKLTQKEKFFNSSAVRYFISAKEELSKVAWPTRRQATRSALIVLALTLFAAVFFAIADFLISGGYLQLTEFAQNVKTS